jgi:gluconokinase
MSLLVLDIGSSSVRALLYEESARPIPGAVARRAHSFTTHADGTSIADAAHLRALTEACIDEVMTHPAAGAIQAVGMATFVGNLLGVDAAGQAVTPVYTYADTRCAAVLETLRYQIDLEDTHQRTGCPHYTAYHPAKLRWLAEQGIRAAQWADIGTACYRAWFGRQVPCSYSVAAWSGLLNRAALMWDAAWLSLLGHTPDDLPPLADYSAAQSGLAPAYANRWPALKDVPFLLAVGDGAAANIGSGAIGPGQAALTIGTTAALRIIRTEALPPVPAGCWSYRVDARRHLIGGATNEGGSTIAWVRETFKLSEDAEAQLVTRPADSHGLTFLPFLTGERSPGYRAEASGTLHGLRAATTPLDVMQAAMEGVALRLAAIAENLGSDFAQVFAGGGALQASRAWAQTCANALAQPLDVLAEAETTARGVAMLLLEAVRPEAVPAPLPATRIQPDPAAVEILRLARARQADLYARLY